jgi:hypothetical protein
MNNNYTSEEWLEKRLEGSLNEQELQEFDEKLLNDPEFARVYKEHLRLKEVWVKAHQLDKTRKEVNTAIQHERTQRRRLIISYAAAASILILIAIPVFLYFSGDFKQKSPAVVETNSSDSLNEIIGIPQFKTAEEKASFGIVDSLKLITPVNNKPFSRNDSVVFRWSPALSDSTYIIIQNGMSEQAVFKEKVANGKDQFILEKGFLPEGQYEWFIEGNPYVGKFRIIR